MKNRPLINTYNSSTGTNRELQRLATSAMSVCLLVSKFVQKRLNGFTRNFQGR